MAIAKKNCTMVVAAMAAAVAVAAVVAVTVIRDDDDHEDDNDDGDDERVVFVQDSSLTSSNGSMAQFTKSRNESISLLLVNRTRLRHLASNTWIAIAGARWQVERLPLLQGSRGAWRSRTNTQTSCRL